MPGLVSSRNSDTPSLKKLLVCGNVLKSHDQTSIEILFGQLGYEYSERQGFPVAAITALTDLEGSGGKTWLRADPVFLHADLTSLLLFDSQNFSLTEEEAEGIFSIINPLLEEDGLRLIYGEDPLRWYLELKHNPSITTTLPSIVNGHDIRPFLPAGKDRTYWIKLGNEIQMLLHDCSINQERQRRGEVPINSVWFWGSGKLPDQKKSKFDRVISNDVNAQGLAIHAGLSYENLPVDYNQFIKALEKDQQLLFVLSQGDLALSEPEAQKEWLIFEPILSNLRKGKIRQLEIITEDQHRIVKRSHLLRFWRK